MHAVVVLSCQKMCYWKNNSSVFSHLMSCESGFQGSLVLFMKTKLGFSNAGAATQMSVWNGVCYLTPLLGGQTRKEAMGGIGKYVALCPEDDAMQAL